MSMDVKSLQSCPTLCNPMVHSPPDSSVYGILQARLLEWIAMPSSPGSSWSKDWIYIWGRFLTTSAIWEAPKTTKLGVRHPGLWSRSSNNIFVTFLPSLGLCFSIVLSHRIYLNLYLFISLRKAQTHNIYAFASGSLYCNMSKLDTTPTWSSTTDLCPNERNHQLPYCPKQKNGCHPWLLSFSDSLQLFNPCRFKCCRLIMSVSLLSIAPLWQRRPDHPS